MRFGGLLVEIVVSPMLHLQYLAEYVRLCLVTALHMVYSWALVWGGHGEAGTCSTDSMRMPECSASSTESPS